MASIVVDDADEKKASDYAQRLLPLFQNEATVVLGPGKLLKRKDRVRYRIVVKSKQEELLSQLMKEAMKVMDSKVKIEMDLNPLDME